MPIYDFVLHIPPETNETVTIHILERLRLWTLAIKNDNN